MLRFHADGCAVREQHTTLKASTRPMNDVPNVNHPAMHRSPEEDKTFFFPTYMSFSHLFCRISSGRSCIAGLDGWYPLDMYPDEWMTLSLLLGSCSYYIAEMIWLQGALLSLHYWCRCTRQLLLSDLERFLCKGQKGFCTIARFEEFHAIFWKAFQEIKDVTGER